MDHIHSLVKQASLHEDIIADKYTVYLAIYFHDVIYDPKSKTNEEDSANLFVSLLSPHLDSTRCEKVRQYITATKKHDVSSSEDTDLKLFIDMDMSILGVSPDQYQEYARQIRQEYEFVPEADYCRGRAAVLESFIVPNVPQECVEASDGGGVKGGGADVKYIFASKLFCEELEDQARRNLAWECEILKSGRLV